MGSCTMSTVIKAGESGPLLRRLSTVDLADHLAEADSVIAAAKTRAADLLGKAEQQAAELHAQTKRAGYDTGHKEGYDAGHKAGFEAGREESLKQFGEEQVGLVSLMRQVIASFEEVKRDLAVTGERDLLEFAVTVAKKLTFAIGDLNRDAARQNMTRALAMIGAQTDVVVRAHPADLDALDRFAQSVASDLDHARSIKVVADDAIAPGGCRPREAPR